MERPGGGEQELPEDHAGRDDRDLESVAEIHRAGEVAGLTLELVAADGARSFIRKGALEDLPKAALRAPLLEDRSGAEAVMLGVMIIVLSLLAKGSSSWPI